MSPVEIRSLLAEDAARDLSDLIDLLRDSVQNGASVGFVLPLSMDELMQYWNGVFVDLATGKKRMLVARQIDTGQIIGCVQLALEQRANGRHRGEVQKLLVHSAARRQGIATRLMHAVEAAARIEGCSLLVLDTVQGSAAETLYERIGYTRVGYIPEYALDPDRQKRSATTIFYRLLDA